MNLRLPLPIAPLVLSAPALAQGLAFQSPGMPGAGTPGTPAQMGQQTRFSTDFNPALGFVIDSVFDYRDFDTSPDGFDASLRLLEFNGAVFVDPNAWAWVAVVAEEDALEVEEAAIQYIGLPGNMGLRGGRFFVDFGKQMQAHLEELRTIERPAVLRTFLGEELAGDGLQFDNWHAVGDESAVRYSLGVFGDLVTMEHHDEEEEEGPEGFVEDRKSLGDLNFTGRLTGFMNAGDNGLFQAGLSGQYLPSFRFSDPTETAPDTGDLDRTVYGLDLTYGYSDAEGNKQFTLGAEYLMADGDLGAELNGATLDVLNDEASGYYAFANYSWDPQNSAGIQYSQVELLEAALPELSELDVYYTHALSEFQRLRLQVTHGDVDGGDDYVRVAIQWTAFLGNHSHGFNW